jgi:predicted hydrocarbon binding protein
MASAERSRLDKQARAASPAADSPSITPVFPLLLLETMRDRDRPGEVLEEEDISVSMPRRLGLSEVVRRQIQHFQVEVRQRRLQRPAQVEDLIRLVVRRPDAEEIFAAAGQRVAQHAWEQRSSTFRRTVRFMPGPIARITAQRATRRLFKQLAGGSKVTVNRWPAELRIRDSLTARADPAGGACAFYGGVYAEVLRAYTGREYRILHPECEARNGSVCVWTVEVAS